MPHHLSSVGTSANVFFLLTAGGNDNTSVLVFCSSYVHKETHNNSIILTPSGVFNKCLHSNSPAESACTFVLCKWGKKMNGIRPFHLLVKCSLLI